MIGHIFNSIYLVGLSVGFPPGIVRCQVFVGNKFRLFAHRDQRRKMNWAFVCQILCNPFGHLVRKHWSDQKRKKVDLPQLQCLSAIYGKWYISDNFKWLLLSILSQTKLQIRFLISWWWWPLNQQIHCRAVFAPGSCRWKCGP